MTHLFINIIKTEVITMNDFIKTTENNSLLLLNILKYKEFSKISFRSSECLKINLIKECDLNCSILNFNTSIKIKKETLKKELFLINTLKNSKNISLLKNYKIVCLLKNKEMDTKFKKGGFYWKEISLYLKPPLNLYINSLYTSIFLHICYFPFDDYSLPNTFKFYLNIKKIKIKEFDILVYF